MRTKNEDFVYSDERFADLQLLRYRVDGFAGLSLNKKKYIYYLAKATLAGRDITTDQYGKCNLDIRKVIEAILLSEGAKKDRDNYEQAVVYLKRLWFSNGIYHHYGCEKFVPEFSE